MAAEPRQFARFDTSVSADNETQLVVLCHPEAFRFSIRAVADASTLDRTFSRREVIDLTSLSRMLPALNGIAEIRAPLVRYIRCGPFTVKLEGDAYNSNIQGEAGAYPDSASASIIVGNQLIVGSVRMTECDRSLPRARPCPEGYAVRLDGAYDAKRHKLVLTKTTSSTDNDDDASRQATTTVTFHDLDLTTWPRTYDDR